MQREEDFGWEGVLVLLCPSVAAELLPNLSVVSLGILGPLQEQIEDTLICMQA